MKLYEVPRKSNIRVIGDGGEVIPDVLLFHRIDGMYSICTDSRNEVVNLAAWTEVEVVDGV